MDIIAFILSAGAVQSLKQIVSINAFFGPPASVFVGSCLFIAVCLANWYAPLRKRVNFYLSCGQKDEMQAYATAEERLYALNGALVPISLLLIVFGLVAMGIIN